ncbi:unnamed protein product [Schistocephalus solidus]|uniref:Uncharacterized protein n=1 Tax=Schistocephalus solidus TaxID=70667 RepID=A0A3P7E378_SCHSO|nr:unnamed protein product [Schistocephalus solidus]
MARPDPGHKSPGVDRNPQHLCHAEASTTAMERLPGENGRQATTQMTFYADVATGAHRNGGQKLRYKETLKKSLKQLKINPATWEDLPQDRPDVLVTKAIPSADGWTDDRLVGYKMRVRLPPRMRPQGKLPPSELNTVLLNVPDHHLHFSNELANRLDNLPVADEDASVENRWGKLRDTVQSTSMDVLGLERRRHQVCFHDNDATINTLLAEKNRYQ